MNSVEVANRKFLRIIIVSPKFGFQKC